MKKTSLLYTAACLLSSMTLCLSGCGDDDPIIETPPVENPKELSPKDIVDRAKTGAKAGTGTGKVNDRHVHVTIRL